RRLAPEADPIEAPLGEDDDELEVAMRLRWREGDHLEVEPDLLARGDEEVEERVRLPAVEVDAVRVRHLRLDVAVELVRLDGGGVTEPGDVGGRAGGGGGLPGVRGEGRNGRQPTGGVEGPTLVGEAQVHDGAGPQDGVELGKRRDRVLEVLGQVVGD